MCDFSFWYIQRSPLQNKIYTTNHFTIKISFIYLKCQFKIPVQMNVNLFRLTCLLFPKQLLSDLVFDLGTFLSVAGAFCTFISISPNTHNLDDPCIILISHGHYKSIDDFTEFS